MPRGKPVRYPRRVEIDPSGWPRVGGTPAGAYHEVEPDLLVAVPRPGYEQTVEGARASLEEMNRIARDRGRRQGLIVLVDRVRSQDAAARRVWRNELDDGVIGALALVGGTMLGRAIGSFFVGVYRPKVPTRLVARFDEALEWARGQMRERGGPIRE